MSTLQSIIRVRARSALLIVTLLVSLVAHGASVVGASAQLHDNSFASMTNAFALERGSSASAEAAVDSLTRALSREDGYHPSSFKVELYRMPTVGQADIETIFAATIAHGDWTAAPELTTSDTYKTIGWTRESGHEAVVGGYGQDSASEQMFVIILRASR
jgi:hypothetical protein